MYMFRVLVLFFCYARRLVSLRRLILRHTTKKQKKYHSWKMVNEIKFQLTELAKSFKSFVRVRGASEAENGGEYIKAVKSSDSKYTVLYFNTYANNLLYRVDWFGFVRGTKKQENFPFFYRQYHV